MDIGFKFMVVEKIWFFSKMAFSPKTQRIRWRKEEGEQEQEEQEELEEQEEQETNTKSKPKSLRF